jgi:hypothetical protein
MFFITLEEIEKSHIPVELSLQEEKKNTLLYLIINSTNLLSWSCYTFAEILLRVFRTSNIFFKSKFY